MANFSTVLSSNYSSIGITSSTKVYDTPETLPLTNLIEGEMVFVTSTNRFYISNGTGWNSIKLLTELNGTDWQLQFTLDNPNAFGTSASDNFGGYASSKGDYLVVTAYVEDETDNTNSGKAYVFDNTTGSLLRTIDNPNAYSTPANDRFGDGVSVSDSYIAISASNETAYAGKVYIFSISTGSLLLTISNPNPSNYQTFTSFGARNGVAISDLYLLVGAPGEDNNSASQRSSGKLYIYTLGAGGTSASIRTVNNPNPYGTVEYDYFGAAVAISGTYAIASAYGEDTASGTNSGKVYIFDATTGSLIRTLSNPNAYGTEVDDFFGYSIKVHGNYLAVGTFEDDSSGNNSGKVYIYDITNGALVHTLNNPNPYGTSTDDQFGIDVAISDKYIAVGARYEDEASGVNSGKVYIFSVSTGNLLFTLDNPNAYSTPTSDSFGSVITINGDYIIVSASIEDDSDGLDSGKVYIFKAIA